MSIKLDPREVLLCLNELGYFNISSKQLKEFLKDLKTLIKYDNKKIKEENQENISPHIHKVQYKTYTPNNNNNNNNEYDIDEFRRHTHETSASEIFDHLYSTSTISSRAKSVPTRNSVITIDITKPKCSKRTTTANIAYENTVKSSSLTNTNSKSAIDSKTSMVFSSDTTNNIPKKINSLKPKVSFIKPRKPLKPCKSDPVNLYQQYQKEWKKQKIPGEDKRFDLRWAIRERMLGEPEIPVQFPTDKFSRKTSRF